MPKLTPGTGSWASMVGTTPRASRSTLYAPASPMDQNSLAPVLPPASVARSVSAAAVPVGNSSSSSTMKWRCMSAVHTRPSTVPHSATKNICTQPIWLASPSIHAPGSVNARPPATMAPADMMVWVTLASFRLALPRSLRKKSEMTAANTMGQGNAPSLSAV